MFLSDSYRSILVKIKVKIFSPVSIQDQNLINIPMHWFSVATDVSGPTVFSQRYGRDFVRSAPKCRAIVVRANSAPRLWIRNGFLLWNEMIEKKTKNSKDNMALLVLSSMCWKCTLVLLYLIILWADGAARRKLCGWVFWSFRSWTPLTGDGKRSSLVAIQSDDTSRFIDHVMHAVFL